MKDQKNKQQEPDNMQEDAENKNESKYIKTNNQNNHPGKDRVAKTERKGAGQQQNSSGGPINS